jgi:hypothetical protein
MAVEHRASTSREALLEASRAELAPHKSLDAVAVASGRVVGAVSVTATLVSALGLVSATTLSGAGWGWALPAVVFSAGSIALAVWATVPSGGPIRPGDLDDVQRFFDREIRRRGGVVRAAAVALGLALLSTPLPLVADGLSVPKAAFNVTVVRRGGSAIVAVQGENLNRNIAVTATWIHGGVRALILSGDIGEGGRLNLTGVLPVAIAGSAGSVEVIGRSGARVVVSRTLAMPGG